MTEKIYVKGSSKVIDGKFWKIFNVWLNIEQLKEYVNDKWYVNISFFKKQEPDQYGNTHYWLIQSQEKNMNIWKEVEEDF